MEEYKGKIKYYEDEIEVLFPTDFNIFKTKLSEMLGLTEDFLVNVKLCYKDEKNKKFEIKNLEDYKLFIKNLKERKDLVILEIEIKDESENDKKKLSESIFSFKSNNNLINNPSINNNINKELVNIDNNSSINYMNSNNNYQNNNRININNNLNNNINKNNFDNIRNNNLENNNISNNNNSNNNNRVESIICPFPCSYCNKCPIYNIIYYCPKCNNVFCDNCELIKGPEHSDIYYKIQNKSQYKYLYLEEKLKFKNFKNNVENKIQNVVDNFVNFIKNEPNQNNNNINNPQENKNYTLVKMARSSYDLKNISDKQILDALQKTNGNIDNAVILLTMNDK